MSKLLRAGVRRYLHGRVLWICLALSLAVGILNGRHLSEASAFDSMHIYGQLLIFAILISISVGTEYGEGGFRNKIVIGYTKGEIFWSEWLIAMLLSAVMFGVCMIPSLIMGHHNFTYMSFGSVVVITVAMLLCNFASVAFSLSIHFVMSGKTVSTVVNLGLILCMAFTVFQIDYNLNYGEFIYRSANEYASQEGVELEHDEEGFVAIKNPRYVDEPLRTVLKSLLNFSAEGQAVQYADVLWSIRLNTDYNFDTGEITPLPLKSEDARTIIMLTLSSLAVITVYSVGGCIIFRRKDLK